MTRRLEGILVCLMLGGCSWFGGDSASKKPAGVSDTALTCSSFDEQLPRKAACSFCPETPAKDACKEGLCLVESPLLTVTADGSTDGVIRLRNAGTVPLTLDLRVGDFYGGAESDIPLGATRLIKAGSVESESYLPPKRDALPAGTTIDVRVSASRLSEAGLMTAALYQNETRLVTLKAVRNAVPFDLRVHGETPERVKLPMRSGEPAGIRLRNLDAMTYRFLWRLELDDRGVAVGSQVVTPKSEALLPVSLNNVNFGWLESGFLRSGAAEGRLYLKHEPDESFRALPMATKSFPVSASLGYWSNSTLQGLLNAAFILLLLLLGVVISLIVNFALPTERKKILIKQRLADLETKLAGVGTSVQSRTLGSLRAEIQRLREAVHARWPIVPETELALVKFEESAGHLGQRIEVTEKAAQLLSALESGSPLAQAEVDAVRSGSQRALALVEKSSPTPDELRRAQEELDAASTHLTNVQQVPTPQLVEALRKRAGMIPAEIAHDAPETQERHPLDKMLRALRQDFLDQLQTEPTREDYVRASAAVCKAELVTRFVRLVDTSGSAEVRRERAARQEDLLRALSAGNDESYREASDIIRQVEQNVSPQDLAEEIRSGRDTLWIEVDPPSPAPFQLVTYRLRLRKPGNDTAAARKKIPCCWTIDGVEVKDNGWTVCSYVGERPAPSRWSRQSPPEAAASTDETTPSVGTGRQLQHIAVSAQLADAGGEVGSAVSERVVVLPPKSYEHTMTRYSVITLAITLLAVGFGLLAGAQEKIQSLNWVAGVGTVLLLGFGADVVKRMLSKG